MATVAIYQVSGIFFFGGGVFGSSVWWDNIKPGTFKPFTWFPMVAPSQSKAYSNFHAKLLVWQVKGFGTQVAIQLTSGLEPEFFAKRKVDSCGII